MTMQEIEALKNRLQGLAAKNDKDAAVHHADLEMVLRFWNSNQTDDNWADVVFVAEGAVAWLENNHPSSN